MFYNVALYIALIVFLVGILYRLFRYFGKDLGNVEKDLPFSTRLSSGISAMLKTVFSPRILSVIKTFFADVLFQANILRDKSDKMSWLAHLMIFWGFILLLLMHALDGILTSKLFSNYQPTLNPFYVLRDVFGLVALIGIALAAYRRFGVKHDKIHSNAMDKFAVFLVALILLSGFLLSAMKIGSVTEYNKMVDSYFPHASETENAALKTFWAEEYGLVVAGGEKPVASGKLSEGRALNDMYCVVCHAKPQSAFASYTLRSVLSPVLYSLDKANVTTFLFYVHFLACFAGLAYLPFSKFNHIFATAVSLLVAAGSDPAGPDSKAGKATRTVIELDGCSHGGLCHDNCIVKRQRENRIQKLLGEKMSLKSITQKDHEDLGCRPFRS